MKYVCIKQQDTSDCAPACLATVLKQYGRKESIARIREATGTDRQGTNLFGIVSAAKKMNFTAKAVKGDKHSLMSEFPLPAIAHIKKTETSLHYVVIHKKTEKYVLIADPEKGLEKVKIDEFLEKWTGILVVLVPTVSFVKGGESGKILTRFISLISPQKRLVTSIFIASLMITFFGIITAFYYSLIMDTIVPNSLENTLVTVSIGIAFVYIMKVALETIRSYFVLSLEKKLDIPLLLGYYQHVLELPMNFFNTRKIGEITSRFLDATKIRDMISNATVTLIMDTIMFFVGGIILYFYNPELFKITIVLSVIYIIIVLCFIKPIKDGNRKQFEEAAQLNSYMVEALNGIETVKAFSAETVVQEKTDTLFIKNLKSSQKVSKLYIMQNMLIGIIGSMGQLLILWKGTVEVLNGNMTLGSLITFNALLGYFLNPITNIIMLQSQVQGALVAAERVAEVFELEAEKNDDEDRKIYLNDMKFPVAMKDIKFRYGTRKLVLDGVNCVVKQGEKVAFVGESGSGKTTLAKLLMSFYEFEGGDIYFGEFNIKDINKESLRKKIAYISQNISLFSATIADNLKFGNDNDVSLEDIIRACKMARADEFIDEMPERYHTVLDENGNNLSGGQKQRLAIARALLRRPELLILDEATSHLDSISEKAIQSVISDVRFDITTVIIAHRLSTILSCDRIYVVDNGKIIEQGNHEQLFRMGGKYYSLWQEQLSNGMR